MEYSASCTESNTPAQPYLESTRGSRKESLTNVLYAILGSNKEVLFSVLEGLQQEGYSIAPIFTTRKDILDTVHHKLADTEAYFTDDSLVYYLDGYTSGIRIDSLSEYDIVFVDTTDVLEELILRYADRRIYSIYIGRLPDDSSIIGYEMNLYVTVEQVNMALSYVRDGIKSSERNNKVFTDANYALSTDVLIRGLKDLDRRDLDNIPLMWLISDHWDSFDKGIGRMQILGSFFSHFRNGLTSVDRNMGELIAVLTDHAHVIYDKWDVLSDRDLARNMLSIIAAGMGVMTSLGYDVETMLNNEVAATLEQNVEDKS